jgi:hypothetical protein
MTTGATTPDSTTLSPVEGDLLRRAQETLKGFNEEFNQGLQILQRSDGSLFLADQTPEDGQITFNPDKKAEMFPKGSAAAYDRNASLTDIPTKISSILNDLNTSIDDPYGWVDRGLAYTDYLLGVSQLSADALDGKDPPAYTQARADLQTEFDQINKLLPDDQQIPVKDGVVEGSENIGGGSPAEIKAAQHAESIAGTNPNLAARIRMALNINQELNFAKRMNDQAVEIFNAEADTNGWDPDNANFHARILPALATHDRATRGIDLAAQQILNLRAYRGASQ